MSSAETQARYRIICWSLWSTLAACTFEAPAPFPVPITSPITTTPFAPIVDSGEQKLFEQPGEMVVYHGFACAESKESDRQNFVRVQQSRALEERLDRATVFLSGWQFRYLNGDHEIAGLGTGIFRIRREGNELRWEAWGAITDNNFDDPYRWCYRYTVVAWNRATYPADPDHRDVHLFQGDEGSEWQTALSYHANYTTTVYYVTPNSAILPRGFGVAWRGGDNNLLQVAYNLDYSENFIAFDKRYGQDTPNLGGADQAAPTFRSWETKTVLKDNALTRDYVMAEAVSVISSLRGGLVQPPFSVVPVEDRANCVSLGDPSSETRTIEWLPFDVAVPILTGWDLSYFCNDQHVEEIGVWIDGFQYAPSGRRGTLEYTLRSILRDDDGGDGNVFRHRVSVLGFDRAP